MLKKLFVISIMMCCSLNVKAGPYIGASIAKNLGDWQIKDSSGNNNKASSRGSMAILFAGYGDVYHPPLYIGGEIFVNNTASKSGTKTINAITGTIKQTYSYGISILPGFVMGRSVIAYARLGYVRTRFQVRTNVNSNKNILGTQLGVGLQGCVSDNVDIRGEYTYTRYRSLAAFNTTFKPINSQYSIGIVYKFD